MQANLGLPPYIRAPALVIRDSQFAKPLISPRFVFVS